MKTLGAAYGRVAELRRRWYTRHPDRRRRLALPVISIGNVASGGSGKTPTVAAIARLLLQAGERPAILSRGYRRRTSSRGVTLVSDGERVLEPVERSGDEPQMLARALPGVPVVVSADRYAAGLLVQERLSSTVILLDDGFQHLRLARDVDLVIVSPADLGAEVLPAGTLRESVSSAAAADAVVVPGTADDAARVGAALGGAQTFRLEASYDVPKQVAPFGALFTPASPHVVAVAGIARPERFFAAAREAGWHVVKELAFPDHHWFDARDIARVEEAADAAHAAFVLTTEKDAMRLADATLARRWAFLPMRVTIAPEEAFAGWLHERLAAARARAVQAGQQR